MQLLKSLKFWKETARAEQAGGNAGEKRASPVKAKAAGADGGTVAKPAAKRASAKVAGPDIGHSAKDVKGGAPDNGLPKQVAAVTNEPVIAKDLEIIGAISPRYPRVDGPNGKLAKRIVDAHIGYEPQAVVAFASSKLRTQLEVAEGTKHSLEGKAQSEILPRQKLAKALIGEISHRVGKVEGWGPELANMLDQLLNPGSAGEKDAIQNVQNFVVAQRELQDCIRDIEWAKEDGFKLGLSAKTFDQACADVNTNPEKHLVGLRTLAKQADDFRKTAPKQQPGGAGGPVEAMPLQEWEPQGEPVQGMWLPGEGPGQGEVGQARPAPKTKEEIAAETDAKVAKGMARVAELKAEVSDAGPPSLESRYQGVMLAMACGDALGATLEFKSKEHLRELYGIHADITGGGPFNWDPGDWTDDTSMAVFMGKAIAKNGGFDQEAVLQGFVDWLDSKPPDVGGLTRQSLRWGHEDVGADLTGMIPWALGGYENAGNGSVMRSGPNSLLTVFADDEKLLEVAVKSSEITHADPRCTYGTAAMAKGVQLIIKGEDNVTEKVAKWLEDKSPTMAKALHDVKDMTEEDLKTTGYVVDTVQAAFWALEKTNNLVDGLVTLVNNGDDTDTAGATGGILLGAKYGTEGIPESWLKKVQKNWDKDQGPNELTGIATDVLKLAKPEKE